MYALNKNILQQDGEKISFKSITAPYFYFNKLNF